MSSEATRPHLRHRHGLTPPKRAARDDRRVRRSPAACQLQPEVTDDLPNPIPVTSSELDVIETYLGDQLALLLGRLGEEARQPEKEKTHDD